MWPGPVSQESQIKVNSRQEHVSVIFNGLLVYFLLCAERPHLITAAALFDGLIDIFVC